MTERERELRALLFECKGFLICQTFIMPQLNAAYQPMIDRITAAIAEPKAGSGQAN